MDDLFPLAFDENEEGYMGTSFKIYIDDSADKERKKFVIAGALIGDQSDWRAFGRKWRDVLKRPPAIKYFHQKEFVRRSGEFEQFTDRAKWPRGTGRDAANSKRDLLRNVLEGSPISAIGIAILIPDYEQVRKERADAAKYFPKDAFEIALQETLNQCVKAVRKIDSKSDLVIISDKSTKASRYTEVFEGFTRKNPVSAQYLRGIMHLDDEKITGLQAADLCAGVIKKEFDRREAGDFEWPIPELSKTFYRMGYWDRDYALSVLDHQSVKYGV